MSALEEPAEGWTFEALDRAEREMAREEAAELDYQERCAARAHAEDEWVDQVVAEQEAAAASKAAAAASKAAAAASAGPASSAGGASAARRALANDLRDAHLWNAALHAHGLRLSANGHDGGRGIVAARPFARGEVILDVAQSVAVPKIESRETLCHHCFAELAQPLRCSRCGYARYCDAECQRAAWATHRAECEMLARVRPRLPSPTILLLARVLHMDMREASLTPALLPIHECDTDPFNPPHPPPCITTMCVLLNLSRRAPKHPSRPKHS